MTFNLNINETLSFPEQALRKSLETTLNKTLWRVIYLFCTKRNAFFLIAIAKDLKYID